jgi:twinkle protein
LDSELCSSLGLVTAIASDGGDADEWVAIPFRREGRTTGYKYRRVAKAEGQPNFSQDKGSPQYFWNYDAITDDTLMSTELIVTEGEFDAIAAMQAGCERVVSVPNGAPDHAIKNDDSPKFTYVLEALPDLKRLADGQPLIRTIVLAVDRDRQGVILLHELAMRFGRGRCKYLRYPDGCNDLNAVLHAQGSAAIAETIKAAPWVQVQGLALLNELPPLPVPTPHPCGIPLLQEKYFLRRGDMTVVTGIPGHGKTTLLNDIACRMAGIHGWRTCFASFEQPPQNEHRAALRTWYHRRPEMQQTPQQRREADDWIIDYFQFVVPTDEPATLPWLLEIMAAAVIRYGTKLCIIDPWNELDHPRAPHQSLTEYISGALRDIKMFARSFQAHVIVAAHPIKLPKDKNNDVPMPTLYDISDSAAWFNKSDAGLIVYRESNYSSRTKIKVAKARYKTIGYCGAVELEFDETQMRYVEPAVLRP